MTRYFVSLRGRVETPQIFEVDLENNRVCNEIVFDVEAMDYVPMSKRGTAGMYYKNDKLYVATWDRIFVVDIPSGECVHTITDPRFTDLHGIWLDENDLLWVTSTNLDGIYTVDLSTGEISTFWNTWNEPQLGIMQDWEEKDYRKTQKKDSPYHHFHVNAVCPVEDYVFASFLGTRPTPPNLLVRKLDDWNLIRRKFRDGGTFVIDRKSGELVETLSMEGTHDSHLWDGKIYATEYFRNAVVTIDPQQFTYERLELDIPHHKVGKYLSRGILPQSNHYWVGHSVYRKYEDDPNLSARMRRYTPYGKWTGDEIAFPGFAGVYSIIEVEG